MAVAPFTPARLERLVRRCLATDPEDRYFSIHDLVLDLRTPSQDASTTAAKPNRWPWVLVAATSSRARWRRTAGAADGGGH